MNVIVRTPATELPLSMVEVLQHLRAEDTPEDLTGKLAAAVASIEMATGPIMDSAWRATFERVPKHRFVHLPAWLVTEVGPVAAIAEDGTATTLAVGVDYVTDLEHRPGRIRMLQPVNGTLQVDFAAGWDCAAVVPPQIRQAILLEIGHMHAHREAVMEARAGRAFQELPRAIQHLTAAYQAAMQLAWSQS